MKVLLLRFDAPLISFGGVAVDSKNVTDEMPSRSMVTGLLGNALGYDHRDVEALARLQQRLRIAVRRDRPGSHIVDFQTVDLGQEFMTAGWTTWGRAEGREGGSAASGTHIRQRHYLADATYTVAVTLVAPDDAPTLEDIEDALNEPARPLFLGRKACLPSTPLARGIVDAQSALAALREASFERRSAASWYQSDVRNCLLRVPHGADQGTEDAFTEHAVTEDRDWPNQVHVGRRIVLEATLACGSTAKEGV